MFKAETKYDVRLRLEVSYGESLLLGFDDATAMMKIMKKAVKVQDCYCDHIFITSDTNPAIAYSITDEVIMSREEYEKYKEEKAAKAAVEEEA